MKSPRNKKQGLFPVHFYRNAIRKGETKALRPVGASVVLYHSGLCAIVSQNDHSQSDGHCVYYKNRCIISLQYARNRVRDVAYRTDGYLLYLTYNEQSKLNGECYLFSFMDRVCYRVTYEEGELRSRVKVFSIGEIGIDTFFTEDHFHKVIGAKHASALKHESVAIKGVKIIKKGNKAQIFFSENPQAPLISGLGFSFVFRAPDKGGYNPEIDKYGDEFELKFVEKGEYKHCLLEGYGQKVFKNNNLYEGYFKANCFGGEGVLLDPHQGSWAHGCFAEGELKDMLDYSNQGQEDLGKASLILETMQQKEPRYVNSIIEEPDFSSLDKCIESVLGMQNFELIHIPSLEEKKQIILNKITSKFLNYREQPTQSYSIKLLTPDKALNKTEKSKIQSLLPDSLKASSFSTQRLPTAPKVISEDMKESLSARQQSTLSRIFKKDYSNQATDNQKGNSIFKLHRVTDSSPVRPITQRLRKSVIFGAKSARNRQQNNEGISKDQDRERSPYLTARSRKSPIFEERAKNREFKNSEFKEEKVSFEKLQSIRKGSVEKRKAALGNQNNVKKSPKKEIFAKERQKQEGFFNYS